MPAPLLYHLPGAAVPVVEPATAVEQVAPQPALRTVRDVLDRALSPLEHTAIDLALRDAVRSAEVPILPMVVDRILTPDKSEDTDGRLAEDGRLVGHALRRLVAGDLQGLFDGPSTVRFDPKLPMISLDLSRVVENSTLISVLMTCSSAWMESALLDPNGGQRWVVYDEAWRLMSHPSLLRRMDAHWRLARHYGMLRWPHARRDVHDRPAPAPNRFRDCCSCRAGRGRLARS